jgi:hypothetical protein
MMLMGDCGNKSLTINTHLMIQTCFVAILEIASLLERGIMGS